MQHVHLHSAQSDQRSKEKKKISINKKNIKHFETETSLDWKKEDTRFKIFIFNYTENMYVPSNCSQL